MITLQFWRWGFAGSTNEHSVTLLGPCDAPLFSERTGFNKPVWKVGTWRLFVRRIPMNLHRDCLTHGITTVDAVRKASAEAWKEMRE